MKNTMLEMTRYAALARQAVAEGVVLLKNEAVLPLAPGGRAALFGYAQFHYYKSGTGSGGLVNVTHVPNLPEILGGDGGYRLDAGRRSRGSSRKCRWTKNLSALPPSAPTRRSSSLAAQRARIKTTQTPPAAFF